METQSSTPLVVAAGVELDIEYLPESYFEPAELTELLPELRALLGTKDRALVRKFRAKSMDRYLVVQGNEGAAVELYCNRPRGWSDILTPESYTAIATAGQELNLPFFQGWYRRLKAAGEAMRPGLDRKVEEIAVAEVQRRVEEAVASAPTTSAPSSVSDAG